MAPKLALRRFDHDLWIAAACDQRLSPRSQARNVAAASACDAFELLSLALRPTSVREDAPQFVAAHESGLGTFETCRRTLRMSVYRGRPEVVDLGSERRD